LERGLGWGSQGVFRTEPERGYGKRPVSPDLQVARQPLYLLSVPLPDSSGVAFAIEPWLLTAGLWVLGPPDADRRRRMVWLSRPIAKGVDSSSPPSEARLTAVSDNPAEAAGARDCAREADALQHTYRPRSRPVFTPRTGTGFPPGLSFASIRTLNVRVSSVLMSFSRS
jgi:hypothetical protein